VRGHWPSYEDQVPEVADVVTDMAEVGVVAGGGWCRGGAVLPAWGGGAGQQDSRKHRHAPPLATMLAETFT
jgi:hypothetical protein